MKTAVITGANRGIGLELCKVLKNKGYAITGVCRQSSEELNAVAARVIEGIDVSTDACVTQLQKALAGADVDLLVNNAGIFENESIEDLDLAALERQYHVNALGPLRVVKALLAQIKKGGRIVMITSRMGSIADNTSGAYYGYRMSKAALNMAMVSLACDLRQKGIAVACVHPGFVKTRMTEWEGDIEPDQAARGIAERIDELNLKTSGSFWHSQGGPLPW